MSPKGIIFLLDLEEGKTNLSPRAKRARDVWTTATIMQSCQSLACLSLQGRKAELGLINLISTGDEGKQYFCHTIKACHKTDQITLASHFLFLHPQTILRSCHLVSH